MGTPQNPEPGDLSIDVTGLTVYDLTPEQIKQKTKLRDGFDKAVACLVRLKPDQIKAAGLSADEVARSMQLLADYKRADEVLPAADKLVELLRETKIETGHQIGLILGDSASQARRRAERDPKAAEVLGALQDLLDYVSAPAYKAAATRAKAAGEEAVSPENGGGAPATP
jgi:hypothetical protein